MGRTYVTDITHFLDGSGEIQSAIPKDARKLASFMVLIIEKVTLEFPETSEGVDTGIRCFARGCHGEIIGALDGVQDPVQWYCLGCGRQGTISNWQKSKWDNISSP